jgi:hypothetical protein
VPYARPHPFVRSAPARAFPLALAVVLVASLFGAVVADEAYAGNGGKREQLRFMWAVAGQESGWDYYARNRSSGAFGKYQIMPFNWPAWATEYLGDRRADQTPWNQERVAYGKMRDLYRWLGSWKRVAYWWLTGKTDRNERRWSAYARGYVRNIMRLRKRAPAEGAPMPARTSSRPDRGDWRRASGDQRLRLGAAGAAWPQRGRVRDGQVLRVRAVATTASGHRWVRVLTADGRLGWLKQTTTVPAHRPAQPARWRDVRDDGGTKRRDDRRMVRPRPR